VHIPGTNEFTLELVIVGETNAAESLRMLEFTHRTLKTLRGEFPEPTTEKIKVVITPEPITPGLGWEKVVFLALYIPEIVPDPIVPLLNIVTTPPDERNGPSLIEVRVKTEGL